MHLADEFPLFTAKWLRKEIGYETTYPGRPRYDKLHEHWVSIGKPGTFVASSVGVQFQVSAIRDRTGEVLFQESRGYIPLKWHVDFLRAEAPTRVVIGTPGSGKTMGIGIAALYMAAQFPHFKFLNVAPTHYQSSLMFENVRTIMTGTPFLEKFVKPGKRGIRASPPRITLQNESTLEFLHVDDGGRNIQSWSGDWVNLDEAGLLNQLDVTGADKLSSIITGLASRLRGIRPDGRPRSGILSLISMAYDCSTLWWLYDLGEVSPAHYYTRTVTWRDNPYYGYKDLENLKRSLRPGTEDSWLEGKRPTKPGNEFAGHLIDQMFAYEGSDEARVETDSNGLVVTYEETPVRNHIYCIGGDPGTGNPPYRNAPVVLVWDITNFPTEPARLVAFWWGYANGSIRPFVERMNTWIAMYEPPLSLRGYDSTSTQLAIAQLAWATDDQEVRPLGFEGVNKWRHINAAKMLMSRNLVRVPQALNSFKRQMQNYSLPDQKIPQDIVSAFCLSSTLIMEVYRSAVPEWNNEEDQEESVILVALGSRFARPYTERGAVRATAGVAHQLGTTAGIGVDQVGQVNQVSQVVKSDLTT